MPAVGRFAPSPSGPLHFGSLVSALASFLQARSQDGRWHVRIDDLDPPRVVTGALDAILHALEYYQLHWDGEVQYQHNRNHAYQQVLEHIDTFYCACKRKDLRGLRAYPGTCRTKNLPAVNHACRCQLSPTTITIQDAYQGPHTWDMQKDCGDFILKRADGVFAYSLATVVDDIALGVTEVIRGVDLLPETAKQAYLYALLGQALPYYGHVPVATHADGQKLSKQSHAPALPLTPKEASVALFKALDFLGQNPEQGLLTASCQEIIAWGLDHWNEEKIVQQAKNLA